MSIKSIPRVSKGILDPKTMYTFSIKSFEEVEWNHKDAMVAYRGKAILEGVVEGTGQYDDWMSTVELDISFYIPTEDVKWYKFAAEKFEAFREAIGSDGEDFDPDDAVSKVFVGKIKIKEAAAGVDKNTGQQTIYDASCEFAKFYSQSFVEETLNA